MRKLTYLAVIVPLIAISYLNAVGAQRFAPGYCPTVTAHEGFDKTKVSGRPSNLPPISAN